MRNWKILSAAGGAVTAVAVAVALGTTTGASGTTTGAGTAAGVVTTATPSPHASVHPGDQWQQLMKDKAFRDEYFALRRAQLGDQQAWWDKYASDPQSSAAQSAWSDLRQKEQTAMAALLKKHGVTLPAPPEGLQQLQKLKDNAQFRSDATKLATQFKADVQAWFKKYGSNPSRSDAQAAMRALRSKYQTELTALLKKYGVTISGDVPIGILGRGLMGGRGGDWLGGPFGGMGGMMDGAPGHAGPGGFGGGPGGMDDLTDSGNVTGGVPAI